MLHQVCDIVEEDLCGVDVPTVSLNIVIVLSPQLDEVGLGVVLKARRLDDLCVVAEAHVLVDSGVYYYMIVALGDEREDCLCCVFWDQVVTVGLIGSGLVRELRRSAVEREVDLSYIDTAIDDKGDFDVISPRFWLCIKRIGLLNLEDLLRTFYPNVGLRKVDQGHCCSNVPVYVAVIKSLWGLVINAPLAYPLIISCNFSHKLPSTI